MSKHQEITKAFFSILLVKIRPQFMLAICLFNIDYWCIYCIRNESIYIYYANCNVYAFTNVKKWDRAYSVSVALVQPFFHCTLLNRYINLEWPFLFWISVYCTLMFLFRPRFGVLTCFNFANWFSIVAETEFIILLHK